LKGWIPPWNDERLEDRRRYWAVETGLETGITDIVVIGLLQLKLHVVATVETPKETWGTSSILDGTKNSSVELEKVSYRVMMIARRVKSQVNNLLNQ
jgi:hypothetical protein